MHEREHNAEWELKAVVPDWAGLRRRLEASGARLEFDGRLEDRRYDTASDDLSARDHVLRLRVYRKADGRVARASVDWKGPTEYRHGYKVREERASGVDDPDTLAEILDRLGFRVSLAIDRTIAQYALAGAVIRLERYPRMDDLVEVEGTAEAIESAIRATGIAREAFTADALAGFAARFEARTGTSAALSDAALDGMERRRA